MRWLLSALLGLVAVLAIAVLFLWLGLRPLAPLAPPAPGAVLDGVTVVVPGEGRWPSRRVVVRGDRIAEVAEAAGDPAAAGAPFAGAFVLPGLNDLHVHWPPTAIPGQTELFAFLYLAHGVTAVRAMGDPAAGAAEAARRGIEAGAFAGPRTLSCGWFVDGDPPLWSVSLVVTSPDEARAAVARIAYEGRDCVKAYEGLDAASLAALRDEAARHGLPVTGHVPTAVPFEVAALGDAQHLIGVHVPPAPGLRFPHVLEAWGRTDDARIDFVARESLRLGIAHTPTLVTVDRLLRARDWSRHVVSPALQLLPPFYRRALWDPEVGMNPARTMEPADFDMVAAAYARMKQALLRLHEAGVELHTGSDTLAPLVVPGISLHRELAIWVEAGIPPEAALAASTGASARFLGVPGLGEIRAGAPAELAVYARDPTLDLANLGSLLAVVRGGRLYAREALDAHGESYRESYRGALRGGYVTAVARALGGLFLRTVRGEGADEGS